MNLMRESPTMKAFDATNVCSFFKLFMDETYNLSLGMDKNLSLLLLLLKLAIVLADSHVLLLPVLRADRVPSGLNDDTLEGFDTLAHLLVQLLLHRVQVEGDVLAEARDESEWLVDALTYMILSKF